MEETVKEINERKNRETNAPESKTNLKEERVRTDMMEFVGGLFNEVFNLNLDVKDEISKVIRLGKKQTDRDTGDTEQKPKPLKVVMEDTNKKVELFKRCRGQILMSQHPTRLKKKIGRKETPRGPDKRDK